MSKQNLTSLIVKGDQKSDSAKESNLHISAEVFLALKGALEFVVKQHPRLFGLESTESINIDEWNYSIAANAFIDMMTEHLVYPNNNETNILSIENFKIFDEFEKCDKRYWIGVNISDQVVEKVELITQNIVGVMGVKVSWQALALHMLLLQINSFLKEERIENMPKDGKPDTPNLKLNFVSATDKEALGAWLRTMRKDAGMTQAEIAEKTGLPRTHVVKLEKGEDDLNPKLDTIIKFVEATGNHLNLTS